MGNLKMVELISNNLIDKNPPLDITGRTPLHVASQRCHVDIIKFIFKCLPKDKRNPADKTGITPLHLAAAFGHLDSLKIFLVETVDKNPPTFIDKKTPLHFAAERGQLHIIEYLTDILPKHQLNDKSASSETPLDYALKNNHEGVANFLKIFV